MLNRLLENIRLALIYLAESGVKARRTSNRVTSSYGWKHVCEDWVREFRSDCGGAYVSNGCFILACVAVGYQVSQPAPGVYLNITAPARPTAKRTTLRSMIRRAPRNTEPHPLEPIARAAFANCTHQDATTLSHYFAGAYVRGGAKAYHTVARDVLGYMESQGKLTRDRIGWYYLTPEPDAPA